MDYVLIQEGYFSDNCNLTTGNRTSVSQRCPSQEYNLELVYTLSVVLSAVFSVIGGVIMDRFGTMVFRNLSTFLFVASCVAVAFSTPQISWILYPAMIILASSGIFLYISAPQTANLFPRFRGTIINLIYGTVAASAIIFAIVKAAFEAGISVKAIFLFIAFIVGVLLLLRTHFLMPKMLIPYDVPEDFVYGIAEYCKSENFATEDQSEEQARLLNHNSVSRSSIDDESEEFDAEKNSSNLSSLKTSILTSTYILGTIFSLVQWFRDSFFIESMNAWLRYMIPHNSSLVGFDVSFFGYVELTSLCFSPLIGAIYDLTVHHFEHTQKLSSSQANLKSLIIVCVVAYFASLSYSVFVLIDCPKLQYATFVLSIFANCFTCSNLSLLLMQFFPMERYGTLYGLATCLIGFMIAMQYPLFYIAIRYFEGNFFVVNVVVLILLIVTLAHPINLYRIFRKRSSKQQ